ncbi:hypothetical protein KFK09_001540 [Dendrobium nobile]|uniref:Uncharacterized protein n=1 Tax=Dendrobium nobile TaxID=94219 RepID=A0A8T3CB64_DENNO|nr:hypothetical protein KFK09_001540 [Dendrobium nobile]
MNTVHLPSNGGTYRVRLEGRNNGKHWFAVRMEMPLYMAVQLVLSSSLLELGENEWSEALSCCDCEKATIKFIVFF